MGKKNKKRKKRAFTIPVALVAGITAPFVIKDPTGHSIVGDLIDGDFEFALKTFYKKFTGVDESGVFNFRHVIENYSPIVVGVGVHYAASKLGINRRIAAAGIPVFRI